jgi:hypothetical protein
VAGCRREVHGAVEVRNGGVRRRWALISGSACVAQRHESGGRQKRQNGDAPEPGRSHFRAPRRFEKGPNRIRERRNGLPGPNVTASSSSLSLRACRATPVVAPSAFIGQSLRRSANFGR